jgi:hypothetical protein
MRTGVLLTDGKLQQVRRLDRPCGKKPLAVQVKSSRLRVTGHRLEDRLHSVLQAAEPRRSLLHALQRPPNK